jgi:lysophospholipase L1-like esterase
MSNKFQNAALAVLVAIVVAATIFVLQDKSANISGGISSSPPTSAAAVLPAQSTAAATLATAPGAQAVVRLREVARTRKPVVTFLGSSLTAGCCTTDFGHTWPYLVQRRLEDTVGVLTITRHVFPGAALPEIVAKGGILATIGDKPDLVVFETSGTNDRGQGITEAASDEALGNALKQLRRGLPQAVIIVQTSSPKSDPRPCAGGITYPQFMAHQAGFLDKQHEALFFDLYAAMDAKIGGNLKPYLHDITHPNRAGAAVWAALLEAYLGI